MADSSLAVRNNATHRVLREDDELAAYLHVTRYRMLMILQRRAATVSQIAEKLGVHPANLTRHMRILEEAGLVWLVEKRDTGRNLEKYYTATATSFEVVSDADRLEAPHKIALALARSDISAAIERVPDADPGLTKVQLVSIRIAPDRASNFSDELEALAARYQQAEANDGDPYHMLLALYPGDAAIADQGETIRFRKSWRKQ